MRLLCKIFGCTYDDYHSCGECGADLYDADFYQLPCYGIQYFRNLRWRWNQKRFYRCHKCGVCEKMMYFTDDQTCSDKCFNSWLPF